MDYINNNPIPSPVPQPAAPKHNKARWIIIFIACLIVLVAVVTIFRKQMTSVAPAPEMTAEERLIDSMTAKNPSSLDSAKTKAIINASTAESDKSNLTDDQRKKLIDAMSAQ